VQLRQATMIATMGTKAATATAACTIATRGARELRSLWRALHSQKSSRPASADPQDPSRLQACLHLPHLYATRSQTWPRETPAASTASVGATALSAASGWKVHCHCVVAACIRHMAYRSISSKGCYGAKTSTLHQTQA